MTISTAIVISAFFLALSPALYKLAELASEWVRVRRLHIESELDLINKRIDYTNNNVRFNDERAADTFKLHMDRFRDIDARFESLEERLIKLNNRVVAGGRKVS